MSSLNLAEAVRFELTEPCGSPVFKTGGLNHSPTLPYSFNFILSLSHCQFVFHKVKVPKLKSGVSGSLGVSNIPGNISLDILRL